MRRIAIGSLVLFTACAEEKRVNYYRDVAPVLAQHCTRCHTAGGIAPFALDSYDAAGQRADEIAFATERRSMPPVTIDASGACNSYSDTDWLTDDEIELLATWAETGNRRGNPDNATPLPQHPETLIDVTLSVQMPEPYRPRADAEDDYRCFLLDAGLTRDRFLTAFEVQPGQPRTVHHVILYAMKEPEADDFVRSLDDADPGPGYECFGGAGVDNYDWVRGAAGWAPGTPPTRYPKRTGIRLFANRLLVMQVHYNSREGVLDDQTGIALELADNVEREAYMIPVGAWDLVLPPGQAAAVARGTMVLGEFVQIDVPFRFYGVYPHMHLLGRQMNVTVTQTGSERCLVDVPRWDFGWQRWYMYNVPVEIQSRDALNISCTYDTRRAEGVTTWGEGTEDEMCLAFFYATL